MTAHQRAIVLAQTFILLGTVPVYYDELATLDSLMRYDPSKVPEKDLAKWVRRFILKKASSQKEDND